MNTSNTQVPILVLYLSALLFIGIVWILLVLHLKYKKRKNIEYIFFFTIFYIYIVKVLDYTLFQFQSLILIKNISSHMMLRGIPVEKSLNLIPLFTLGTDDIKTSLLNILMMIPFGLGLPLITTSRLKKVVLMGFLFSIFIEFLQLITGYIGGITFRVADINDVIFNTTGSFIGYLLFIRILYLIHHMFHQIREIKNSLVLYIVERPQLQNEMI